MDVVRKLLASTPFKIAFSYAALFLISTMVVLAFIYVESQGEFEELLRDRLHAEAKSLRRQFDRGGMGGLRASLKGRIKLQRTSGFYYAIESSAGQRLAGNLPETKLSDGWHETHVLDDPDDPEDDEKTTLTLLGISLEDRTLLVVGASQEHAEDLQEAIIKVAGLGLGVAALLAMIGGLLMSRTALNRVSEINLATNRIMGGDLSGRLPVDGYGDEIDQLTRNINAMLVRIEQLMATTKQVSSDIAHELRTPLTRMVQRLDKTKKQGDSPESHDAAMAQVLTELHDILETFDALLRIGQLDASAPGLQAATVDLSELVTSMADTYQAVAAELGQALQSRVAPNIQCQSDKRLVSQMLSNVIENAIKHCPAGSEIQIQLRHAAGKAVLTVSDNGPGIPERDRDKVFQPFYRLEQETKTDGKGLGMAVVAAIARLLNVGIQLGDNAPGLCVTLTFPALEREAQARGGGEEE